MGTAVPGPVGLVECSAYPDRIILKWEVPATNTDETELKDLSGFKVYRIAHKIGEECADCKKNREVYANVDIEDPTNAAIVGSEVIYTDKKVSVGYTYGYKVAPYSLKGREGPASTEVEVEYQTPPQPPSTLDAVSEAGKVILKWTPPADRNDIRAFRIYRGTEYKPEAFEAMGIAMAKENRYEDSNVQEDKTYFYLVRSLRLVKGIALESEPSPIAMAVIKPAPTKPPTGLEAGAGKQGIKIVWNQDEADKGKLRYNIYRSSGAVKDLKLNKTPLEGPTFLDKTVTKGRHYSYSVTAFPVGKEKQESEKSTSTESQKF